MAKYKAMASYRVHLIATSEAESESEAWDLAEALDGGAYEQLSDRGLDDFSIDEVFLVHPEAA